ncbi:rod shape-determining protein MreD [Polaribacter sp. Hel1_33_78]|jgi:rod shape-determining protein MreD|uniref:rod shape-determining protein MreD n=2 Tax=unclassified Polaribacter TaxID=196858 RepID=UPI00087B9095|nr:MULTISPECIES: rod shape-determining protein MreD [unclassified Polaribacter]MDG1194184.1 rod shape-determining protein MreD [Polaribacter sp.]MDG1403511.1 rod shape-determining protein MreD [Polaribacter sp.]MDG2437289.1 rod shape-determining protein MreD [Polaribacter sp.]SDU22811.1 rod shape-determining protein MreD [Polaribacter sp. Hel1_33_78]
MVTLFIFLLFLQVFVLNNILFLDSINPYLYIVFVFLYPLKTNRIPFLFYSFLLGLLVDFFSDSGGIHAFSILYIAYIRLFFIRIYFRKVATDFAFFKLKSESFGKVFNYVVTLTVIHHLIYFTFANFSFQNLSNVILNTLFSCVFTLTLYFLGTYLFTKNE